MPSKTDPKPILVDDGVTFADADLAVAHAKRCGARCFRRGAKRAVAISNDVTWYLGGSATGGGFYWTPMREV